MTINLADNNPRIVYSVAEGVTQTSFAVPFEFFEDADVNIYVDGVLKVEGTDYTLTGGNGATGTLTFVTAEPGETQQVTGIAGGSTVILFRRVAIERTTDFQQGVDISRPALNQQLDVLTALVADMNDRWDRAVKLADSDSGEINFVLPDNSLRASKYFAFDVNGDPVATSGTTSDIIVSTYAETFLGADSSSEFFNALSVTPYAQSLFDDSNAAAARSTLGLGNIATTDLIDEDSMSSDSAARAPTQQSVKSYVDTSVAAVPRTFRFISSIDVSATAGATFTLDSTLYDAYEFVISNLIPTADNSALMLRTSSDGGSTYDNGLSDYSYAGSYVSATDAGTLRTSAADNLAIAGNVGNASGEDGYSGTVRVFGPHLARKTIIRADGAYYLNSGAFLSMVLAGERKSTSPVDAIRIFYGATTMASGTITLYGLRNA